MPKFRIEFEKIKCIGCGTCVSLCPENWGIGPDGKANPKNLILDEPGCNGEAERACPVRCIKIIEERG